MDLRALVASTRDPAFASDADAVIVGWNAAAEALLGHPAESVLGRPCHGVVCGTDLFGNVYCRKDCAVRQMIRRSEPVHGFEFQVRSASGAYLPVACSVMALAEGPPDGAFSVLHVLRPPRRRDEAGPPRAGGRRDLVARPAGAREAADSLTRREVEVLRLLDRGLATPEMADALSISVNTVRSHTRNLLRKLDVHSKLQAVALARRHDLI